MAFAAAWEGVVWLAEALYDDAAILAERGATATEFRKGVAAARLGITAGSINVGGSMIISSMQKGLGSGPRDDTKTHPGDRPRRPRPISGDDPAPVPGIMQDYAGLARPHFGPVGLQHYFGVGPLHVDSQQRNTNTRAVLRSMANKRALDEIDTAMGRKRPRDMRHRRRRIDPEILRNVRRRLDLEGFTDFVGEARRVWDEVQPFLPRH